MINQRGVSAIAVILIILILLALGGGGFFMYKKKQGEASPQTTTFDYVDLNGEVVVFLFQNIPRLYNRVVKLNNELSLIAAEMERMNELESQYPSGKRIIEDERIMWVKLQKDLNLTVETTQNAAERYYVAYMVNSQKGKELISENIGDLVSDIDEVLADSNAQTRRLKTTSSQTFLDRLKGLF